MLFHLEGRKGGKQKERRKERKPGVIGWCAQPFFLLILEIDPPALTQ